jgi:hypothetical protein
VARRNSQRETVEMPTRLTSAMRRAWRRVDGWATDEQMDLIWAALLLYRIRRHDGDGRHG